MFAVDGLLSPRRQQQWFWSLLALGLAARVVRYLLCFPLWEDEAMLATNYLHRGYLGLLEPLNYCQVAPPLYLWSQLALTKLLGFNEYALRLTAFVFSVASLVLFVDVARRMLRGSALVVAVGIFAAGYPGIRYAAEAKPYGCDLFLALLAVWLVLRWWQRPEQTRWLWALAALVAPAIGFSFPMLFVAPTVGLVVAASILRRRNWRAAVPWAIYSALLVGAFFAVLVVSRAAVGDAVQDRMTTEHWGHAFPPLAHPLQLPLWLLGTHTGALLAYPIGDQRGGSTLTFLCVAVGLFALWRRRQWRWLGLCLIPLAMNLAAAALHKYPYGGHVRMGLYHGWAFCLLTALGMTAVLARWQRHGPRVLVGVLAGLVLLGSASLARDLTHPYKSTTTRRARDFAYWFWPALSRDAELVCLETDLHADLSPGTYEWGWSALYLCNQRIYSPRHARGAPPELDKVSAAHPLRCVLYRSTTEEHDHARFAAWLTEMQTRYALTAHERFPFVVEDKGGREVRTVDTIELLTFVPRESGANAVGWHR